MSLPHAPSKRGFGLSVAPRGFWFRGFGSPGFEFRGHWFRGFEFRGFGFRGFDGMGLGLEGLGLPWRCPTLRQNVEGSSSGLIVAPRGFWFRAKREQLARV